MRKIPGFEGYKSREQSRNADKIQRTFIAKSLRTEKGRISDIGQAMTRSGNIMMLGELDRVTRLLEKVTDRIEHAEYGYSSLFSSTKVDVMQLDSLYEYDLGMLDDVSRITEGITALEASMEMEDADPKGKLKNVERAIKDLDQKIDGRQKLLQGVE